MKNFLLYHIFREASIEESRQIFIALLGLITAGKEPVQFGPVSTPLSFYNFKLPQTISNSVSTVRNLDAYLVLEKCFYVGFFNFY